MNLQERSDLVLTFAQVLQANGQSTDETIAATERLGRSLGLSVSIIPRWGELQLQAEDGPVKLGSVKPADPTGVDMDRVASATRTIAAIGTGRLAPPPGAREISTIPRARGAAPSRFTLAP